MHHLFLSEVQLHLLPKGLRHLLKQILELQRPLEGNYSKEKKKKPGGQTQTNS